MFNIQKNGGYELEHNYGTIGFAMKNYYYLLQIAHLLHQLMVRSDLFPKLQKKFIKQKFAKKYNLQLRIGIHTGIAIAGVIGKKKFSYDLWGDSVNIASRFESSGQPEKIHITEQVKNILGAEYLFESCGEIEIKGKGMMQSYFLLGKKGEIIPQQERLITSKVA